MLSEQDLKLHQAMCKKDVVAVRAAILAGSNARDPYFIYYAAEIGSLEIARVLVEHHAQVNSVYNIGRDRASFCITTPIQMAVRNGSLPMVKYLKDQGADMDILQTTTIYRSPDPLCSTQLGTDTHTGWSLLHLAVSGPAVHGSSVDMARFLVEECHILIDKLSDEAWSALHVAARFNHLKAVEYLVERGADVFLKNNQGETPLDCAKKWSGSRDHSAIIRCLEQKMAQKQMLSFALGRHRRAGSGSPIPKDTDDVMRVIQKHLIQGYQMPTRRKP